VLEKDSTPTGVANTLLHCGHQPQELDKQQAVVKLALCVIGLNRSKAIDMTVSERSSQLFVTDAPLSRRGLMISSLNFLGMYALLGETSAMAADGYLNGSNGVRRWLDRYGELAHGLANGSLSQVAWQAGAEQLCHEVDVSQLLAEVKGANLVLDHGNSSLDAAKRRVNFVGEDGKPVSLSYHVELATYAPGNVVPPHLHRNMVVIEMTLAGEQRARSYDLLSEVAGLEGGAAIVRPSSDRILGPGDGKAITTTADNIHWFAPVTSTVSVLVLRFHDIGLGSIKSTIQPVDVVGGVALPDGTIRAPFLDFETAARKYLDL
jgi:hypothetical protein